MAIKYNKLTVWTYNVASNNKLNGNPPLNSV